MCFDWIKRVVISWDPMAQRVVKWQVVIWWYPPNYIL